MLELDYSRDPEYLWYPEVLAKATHSSEYLSRKLNSEIAHGASVSKDHLNKEYFQNGLGITDATDDELERILSLPAAAVYYFADMVSRRAHIGWSTHGHSAVDVNIYGTSHGTSGCDSIRGNNENTDVGKFLRKYLDVDVNSITKELNREFSVSEAGTSWMGKMPTSEDITAVLGHHETLYGVAP
jgi:alkaline phosphatase